MRDKKPNIACTCTWRNDASSCPVHAKCVVRAPAVEPEQPTTRVSAKLREALDVPFTFDPERDATTKAAAGPAPFIPDPNRAGRCIHGRVVGDDCWECAWDVCEARIVGIIDRHLYGPMRESILAAIQSPEGCTKPDVTPSGQEPCAASCPSDGCDGCVMDEGDGE